MGLEGDAFRQTREELRRVLQGMGKWTVMWLDGVFTAETLPQDGGHDTSKRVMKTILHSAELLRTKILRKRLRKFEKNRKSCTGRLFPESRTGNRKSCVGTQGCYFSLNYCSLFYKLLILNILSLCKISFLSRFSSCTWQSP
jgi:hypothetical protein